MTIINASNCVPSTGAGTVTGNGDGPLMSLANSTAYLVNKYWVSSFSIRLNVLTSALNTTGYVTVGTWNDAITTSWGGTGYPSDVGIDTILRNAPVSY